MEKKKTKKGKEKAKAKEKEKAKEKKGAYVIFRAEHLIP